METSQIFFGRAQLVAAAALISTVAQFLDVTPISNIR
jgi:hypothetical protein